MDALHGDVGIVAAGVHDALDLGGELEARLLLHGKGIHVRAQQDRRARPGALEGRHDGREPFTRPDRKPQALELLDDSGLSAGQMQAELWVAVYRTAQADHLGL